MEMMLYPISKFVRDSVDLIVGYIDASGTVKVEPRFAGGGHFFEGKASVVDYNGKSGFLDLAGTLAIPSLFLGVSEFHEGVCSIGADRGVGYIDHSGKWRIPPGFLIAMPFSEGRAFVSGDGETFRMIGANGMNLGSDCFERVRALRAGLAPVMKGGRWGFIDCNGITTIPFTFDDIQAQHFKFGLAPVKFDGKWGMLDIGGGVRISPKWDELGQFVNGLAAARINGKFGYIDPVGDWAIHPLYDKAKTFFGELALVHTGTVPSYVRCDGELIWQFEPHAIVPRPPVPL